MQYSLCIGTNARAVGATSHNSMGFPGIREILSA